MARRSLRCRKSSAGLRFCVCPPGGGTELYGQDGGRPGGRARALGLKSLIADQPLSSIGTAYAIAGRYAEAVTPLRRFLTCYPNILPAHLTLAVVYSGLGQAAEARAEAAEVLRLNPKFSLEVLKQRSPIKDPAVLERHIAALRKAGIK